CSSNALDAIYIKEGERMDNPPTEALERRAFILLVVFLAPILAFMVVGGYGFAVWMSQLVLGPPGG
ncbi:MAG: periplasmic nitrate reductase, NapE protein, partial [Halioglobus sp.]